MAIYKSAYTGPQIDAGISKANSSIQPSDLFTASVGSAATLTTARTLTIGSTGKSFNGSSNVTWTLNEIGVAAKSEVDDNNLLAWIGL